MKTKVCVPFVADLHGKIYLSSYDCVDIATFRKSIVEEYGEHAVTEICDGMFYLYLDLSSLKQNGRE